MISMKVVISLAVIAVAWIVLLVIHLRLRRNNKNSAPALSVTTENPAALAHDPAPQAVSEEKREPRRDLLDDFPVPQGVKEDSEEEKFKKRLRELRAEGLDPASSVTKIWDEYGGTLESEEVLDALVELGYEAAEVVPVLLSRGYHLPEIFNLIGDRYNPGAEEWLDLLWPAVPSDVVSVKVGKILDAFREGRGDDSLEWGDFVEPLLRRGLKQEDVLHIIYEYGEQSFCDIVAILPSPADLDPEFLAATAKAINVDLAEEENYTALREKLDFDRVARIMKAAGIEGCNIVDSENNYSRIDYDELTYTRAGLKAAGMDDLEVLASLSHSNIDCDPYDIISFALSEKIPTDVVAKFVKEAGIEAEDLDRELSEKEVDLQEKVGLLYSLLFHKKDE